MDREGHATGGSIEIAAQLLVAFAALLTAGVAGAGSAVDTTPQFESALNRGLMQWSSGWAMDRYVMGSAQVTAHELRQGIDVVAGTFSFLRLGSGQTIPFVAALVKNGMEYRAVRLCYADESSGMHECADVDTLLREGKVIISADRARLTDRVFASWLGAHETDVTRPVVSLRPGDSVDADPKDGDTGPVTTVGRSLVCQNRYQEALVRWQTTSACR